MNIKFQMGFFILAGILFLVLIVWMFITERRLKRFFMGKKAKDRAMDLYRWDDVAQTYETILAGRG